MAIRRLAAAILCVACSGFPRAAYGQSAPPTAVEMIDRAKHGILRLEVDKGPGTGSVGTCFVISTDGVMVTNRHVIAGGRSARAFLANGTALSAELISVSADYDLAILQLDQSDQQSRQVGVLAFSTQAPRIGTDVWAIGYAGGLEGDSVTKGIVSAIRTAVDAPGDATLELIYSTQARDVRLIQTDCTLNHGNSGGPLLDSEGHVVGVNTWIDSKKRNVNYAIQTQHAAAFVRSRPAKALTFAGLPKELAPNAAAPVRVPLDISPLSSVSIQRNAKAEEVRQALTNLRTRRVCPVCDGRCQVTKEVYVERDDLLGIGAMVRQKQAVPCTACGATGRNTDEKLALFGGKAFEKISRLSEKVKGRDETLDFFVLSVRQAFAPITDLDNINDDSCSLMDLATPGTGAIFFGEYLGETVATDQKTPLALVKISESPGLVVVADWQSIRARPGERVIAGGAKWGRATSGGASYLVLRYGVVAPQ